MPESKSPLLNAALGVTKFMNIIAMILATLCCAEWSVQIWSLMFVQQPEAALEAKVISREKWVCLDYHLFEYPTKFWANKNFTIAFKVCG
jgi:hypothetical protein